jgi:Uncharacterised nucleotidyltransferase
MDALLRSLVVAVPDDLESFRTIVGSVSIEAWPSLLEHAARHGLLGVLAPYLEAGLVPEQMRASFDRQTAIRTMWGERIVQSFEDVVRLFDGASIPVCALKGPALASRLYHDATARSSIDLDFLIAPADLERVVELLREHGYSYGSESTASYLLRHSHHLHFSRPGALSIEVHFQAYAGFGVTLPSSALLARARPYEFSDRHTVLIPSPEDEFVYLSIHAAGHYFVRLLWLCDLKFLIRENSSLDWDLIAARARAAGVATAVGYAVKLLREWLALPLDHVRQKFPEHGLRLTVGDRLLPLASTAWSGSRLDNLKGLFFSAMLCDRPASTIWLLQHHLLRSVRRRAHRTAPGMLPQSWSG